MSWALEEWKEGLPTRALQKIQELEGQLDKLKKEKQQRQFQLDTLEAALQKQKQKVETEKTEGTNLKRENQRLMEICENLEKTKQKISHELQVKESQVNFQEGQLNSGKKQIEKLEQELKRCKTDLERSQQAAQSGDASLSTPQRTFATPLTPSQLYSGSKYEDLKEKYNKEIEERNRLEAEVRALQAKRGSQAVPQTSMNHRDIARHQASSSVFSWQQERTPNRLSSHPQKTPSRRDFSASHIFGEEEVTPSRSVLQTGHRDANSSWHNSSCGSPLLGQLKSQNQELRSKVNELELRLQGQEKEMKSQAHRFQELQLQLEKTKAELIEKDKVLNKNRDELVKTSAQHDQAATKCTALEQKLKKLTEDMSCQRQNAESARCSLEQRVKEKEKELQEELSRQQRAFQTLDQESTQMKARLTQELQQAKNTLRGLEAELDKVSSAKLQLEKNLEEFKQKCSRMEQASEERQVEEQALRSSSQEMKKENGFLRAQSEQRAREVSHLEEELRKARVCLSQSQNFTEEMRAKNASQETMMRELQEKINQQENSFTLEKLKLTLADLEKQRDCSQDLLKKREHHIEQLNEKLSKMEKESKALMSALELTKKEYEELNEEKTQFSRWRSENEKLLHQMESEKESLQSKVHHLEMCLKTQQIKSHEYNERVRTLEMERDNLGVEMRNLCSVVDSKTREAEMQKQAYEGLQQKAELSEQKHKKEMENLCMKTSQLTGQVEDLEQRLQLLSSELLDKAQHYQELQAEYENLRDLFKSKESARSQGDHQSSCLAFEQQSAMSASFVNVMGEQGSNSLERSRCLLDADPSPKSPAILHSRVISLEFSLESQKQMNSDLQKQCEELVHIKEEIEENLIKAEQMHESFVAETSQCICKLQEDTSVHQNVVAETLVALENKEKELQLWKARLEVEQVEIQELKKSNQLLEDSLKELQLLCETLSSEKKEMSSIISLSKKEIEELTQENGTLKEMNEILNQEKMNLLQKNEKFSNCIEKQEKSISELSDQYKQERLFLLQRCEETGSAFEDLSEKYKAAQEKNLRLECLLNECNSVSESRKNELEQLKATFAKEHQEFFTKLAFAEEENQKLILEFEVVQQALKSEIRDLRSSSKSETDALQQEITALKEGQNKMQKEVNDLFQENEQLMKLTKTKHEGQHLELEPVRDPVNERESEIDMCSFQLHTDLGVEDIAPNNSNAQMVQLEALIGNTELNPQESEKEKESLQQEVQTLKGELKAGNLQGRSSQEMSGLMDCEADAEGKYSAVLCELSPRQGDHAHWRCSSLQAALSKLGELEKMCEMLQVEKLQLVSELNDSRAECITATSRMAEEVEKLVNEMKILNDDNGLPQAESVGEMPANEFYKWKNEQTLVSSNPLDTSNSYEQLTLSNKEVQTHFAELQEKFSSLLSEHKILHDQRCQMSSKMSELWSYVDTLKAENSALSVNLRNLQSDSAKEMKPEEHVLSLSFSCVTNSPSVTSFGESSFYKDVLEQTGDTSFLSNLGESVPTNASLEEECLTTKEAPATAERSVEELETLCQGYLRSLKNLQEEMESQAMVKDKEIQELGELLSSERTELDCLRKQYLSQNEQWQQKLTSVTLEMESKLAAEKQQTEHLSLELEVARLQLQGLELSSQSLLGADNEEAIQSQNGSYDIKESEEYTSEITEKTPKRDSHQICEEVVQQDLSVESEETTEGPRVPQGAREVPSEATDDTAVGVRGQGCLQHTSELSSCGPHALAPMEFVENQVSIQTLQLQVKEASNENLRLLHALEDRDRKVENLLNEIKELDSRLDLQELQLRTKIKMCLQLEKIVEELKKEKCNLSEKLESFSRADQELGPRVETSEALSSNLEMGTDDSPQEVLEENVPMVGESRKDGFLAAEIKAEDAGIEHRALAMEADLEVAQNEKLCLERDKENCQKVIVHLEEELSVATSERNRLHGELDTVTKENRTLAQMSEAMKEKVQALEAEVRDKAAVLQTLSSQLSELSADRGDLQKQLRRLEGDSQALSSAARELESQVGRLDKEKESLARESESLQAQMNELEQERLSASRALEVALMEKDELAERLGSTQQEVHQLRKGMEKLRVRIEADEKKQLHVLEKLKGCERDNDALRDKVEGLQRELQMSEENQELVILDAENAKAEAESLRAQVDEMAESLRGSRVDLTTLRSEKGDLTKQLQEQQGQASKLEARLSSLQSLVEEKEQARAHMQEESRTAVEMIQAQVRELTEEVAALCQDQGTPKAEEQNLDAPGNEVPRLRYSLGRLRARLDADREKQLRVLGQLKGSECCVQLLQGSVESLQRELELSGRSQEQAVREAENSKAEVETLKAEIQEISQNLRDLKVDLVNTKSEKEDLTRGLQKEQARVSELEIRNFSLENLLQEKEHQNVQVKEESEVAVETLQAQLKLLNEKVVALCNDQEACKTKEQSLSSRVDSLEVEKAHLLQDLEGAKRNYVTLQSSVNGLMQEVEDGKQELERKDEELSRLQGQVQDQEQLASQLSQVEGERQLWQKQKAELEQKVQGLQSQNHTLRDSLEALQNSCQELERELSSTKVEKISLVERVNTMTAKEAELQAEMQDMVQKTTELKEEFSGEKNRLTAELNVLLEEIKSSKTDHLKYVDQLKKENERAQGKIKLLLKSCRQLEEEKKMLQKELSQGEAAQKQNTGALEANVDELRAEIRELKETLEDRAKEADEYLDKYCSLLISHEKLEKAKEMLETQVARLSSQHPKHGLSGSPLRSSATPEPSPAPLVGEGKSSSGQSKASGKRQRCSGNWESGGGLTPSTPEAFPKKSRTVVGTGGIHPAKDEEFEPEGLPEVVKKGFADIPTGKTSPYVLRRTTMATRTSPRLAAQKSALSPLSAGKENLAESSKPTAGGSRSQKVKVAQRSPAGSAEPTVKSASVRHLSGRSPADSPRDGPRTRRSPLVPRPDARPEPTNSENCRVQ